jgi:hypothetical protein
MAESNWCGPDYRGTKNYLPSEVMVGFIESIEICEPEAKTSRNRGCESR